MTKSSMFQSIKGRKCPMSGQCPKLAVFTVALQNEFFDNIVTFNVDKKIIIKIKNLFLEYLNYLVRTFIRPEKIKHSFSNRCISTNDLIER